MPSRTYDDRQTRPMFPEEREALADTWLGKSGEQHGGPVDIHKILKLADINFAEWSVEKMGADRARAYPHLKTIVARPRLYQDAKRGESAALMDIAHEFSHCVINDGHLAKPLKAAGNASLTWIDERESEENIAWQLARAIMMPRAYVRDCDSAGAIAERFNVPIEHAKLRLAELRFERRKGLQSVQNLARPILTAAEEQAWRRAAISGDHDPEWYRLSNGHRLVALAGCRTPEHPLSWSLYNGRIYAKDELDPSWF